MGECINLGECVSKEPLDLRERQPQKVWRGQRDRRKKKREHEGFPSGRQSLLHRRGKQTRYQISYQKVKKQPVQI